MSMFLNYHNISDNYKPNNLICTFPVGKSYTKLDPVQASKPYEEYDSKGNLIGYFWHYGETLNLEFNIDGEITVEDGAMILTSKGSTPSPLEGALMQRAYNIADKRSWTCTDIVDNAFIWTEDAEFTYDESGKSVYVTAADYMKDKQVDVTLYNFRMEPIHSETFNGNTKIIFPITTELSK